MWEVNSIQNWISMHNDWDAHTDPFETGWQLSMTSWTAAAATVSRQHIVDIIHIWNFKPVSWNLSIASDKYVCLSVCVCVYIACVAVWPCCVCVCMREIYIHCSSLVLLCVRCFFLSISLVHSREVVSWIQSFVSSGELSALIFITTSCIFDIII